MLIFSKPGALLVFLLRCVPFEDHLFAALLHFSGSQKWSNTKSQKSVTDDRRRQTDRRTSDFWGSPAQKPLRGKKWTAGGGFFRDLTSQMHFFLTKTLFVTSVLEIFPCGALAWKGFLVPKVVMLNFNQTYQNFADFTKISENYRIELFFCNGITKFVFTCFIFFTPFNNFTAWSNCLW